MVLSLWFEKNDSHVVGWRGCCLVVVVVMVCANTPATPPPHKKQRQPLPHKCCTSGMMWRRNAPHARVVLMCALAFCVCGHTTVGRHRAPCYVVRPASRHWHARTSVCVPTNRVPLQTALKRRANVSSCVCMCEGLQRIGGAGEKGLTPRPHHPKDKQTPSHKPTIRLAYDVVLPCNNDQKQSRLLGKQPKVD